MKGSRRSEGKKNMNKLKILLTFDHELPLGGLNTSFHKALFEPTNKLLDIAELLDVKINLFTDILCALKFKTWDYEGFYLPYINQIKQTLLKNNDVQLHLHPHWLTTEFKGDNYFPSSDFKLADFRNKSSPENIEGVIFKGYSTLTNICKHYKNDYNCIAYRAGGYNLEPCAKEILTWLYKAGIRIDSSISKGYYYRSALNKVDYFNMPSAPNWFIGLDGALHKAAKEGIYEIPISSKPKSLFEKPTSLKLKKYSFRAPENHGRQIHEGKPAGYIYKIKQAFSSRMLSFDNYTYSSEYLMSILNYNIEKYKNFETVILSVISHPKSMSDYSFLLMKKFIEMAREKYTDKIEFTTYSNIYKELALC